MVTVEHRTISFLKLLTGWFSKCQYTFQGTGMILFDCATAGTDSTDQVAILPDRHSTREDDHPPPKISVKPIQGTSGLALLPQLQSAKTVDQGCVGLVFCQRYSDVF